MPFLVAASRAETLAVKAGAGADGPPAEGAVEDGAVEDGAAVPRGVPGLLAAGGLVSAAVMGGAGERCGAG